jgi:hypothetical protein
VVGDTAGFLALKGRKPARAGKKEFFDILVYTFLDEK